MNQHRRITMLYLILLLLIVLFTIYSYLPGYSKSGFRSGEYLTLNRGWTLTLPDGSVHSNVSLPHSIEVERGDQFSASVRLPNNLKTDTTLLIRSAHQDIQVHVGSIRLMSYTYQDAAQHPIDQNFPPTQYLAVDISPEFSGERLTISYTVTAPAYAGTLSEAYLGNKLSLFYMLHDRNLLFVFASAILLVIGALLLLQGLVRSDELAQYDSFYMGICLLFLGIWFFVQMDSRQIYFSNTLYARDMEFYSLLMIPVPAVLSINTLTRQHYQRAATLLCYGFVAGAFLVWILSLSGMVNLLDLLPIIHAEIILTLLFLVTVFVLTYLEDPILFRQIRSFIAVYSIFAVFALLEVLYMILIDDQRQGLFTAAGAIAFAVGIALTQMHQTLKDQMLRQTEHIRKDTRDAFWVNITHELRTPINIVLGSNQVILKESRDPAILSHAADIDLAAHNLLLVMNDLLDFSKLDSSHLILKQEPYSLAALIQDSLTAVSANAQKKKLQLMLDADPELPAELIGDEARIRQILINILSNAVKYTPHGFVHLTVRAKSVHARKLRLILTVRDSGIGISEADQKKLLTNPGHVIHSSGQEMSGAGLGLSIVQSLIQLMHGTLSIDSSIGHGSVFTIELPQSVSKQSGQLGRLSVPDLSRSYSSIQSTIRAPEAEILLVDDSPMNLRVLSALLGYTGAQITTAAGGTECLRLTHQYTYDLIFLDYRMPEMDGIEVFHAIRSDSAGYNKDTPIVMLTAQTSEGSFSQFLREGFSDYLAKPVEYPQIEDCLKKHLPQNLIQIPEQFHSKSVVPEVEMLKTEAPAPTPLSQPQAEVTEVESDEAECSDTVAAIARIPEIDLDTGMKYCMDDPELYLDMVHDFLDSERTEQLHSCFETGDLAAYLLHLHSLKSTSLTIGAARLSEITRHLEKRLREFNEALTDCKAEHDELLSVYRTLIADLRQALGELS